MPLGVSMTIHGGADLERKLKEADAVVRRSALEGAVVPQAERVAEAARARAPRSEAPGRHGHMADSIAATVREADDQHIDVFVGPSLRHFYARFAEFGTAPHEIGDGIHPGTTARPFLRPALDMLSESIVQGIGEELGRRLEAVRP